MGILNVVPFRSDENAENNQQQVIKLLEDALKSAKEGKPESLAVIILTDTGVMTSYHHGGAPFKMIGAIEVLKFDYIHAQIEGL